MSSQGVASGVATVTGFSNAGVGASVGNAVVTAVYTPNWDVAAGGNLPALFLSGTVTETPENNVIGFQPAVGPPKYRRRSTASGEEVVGSLFCNSTQRSQIQDFYKSACLDGSLSFIWTDPVLSTVETMYWVEPPRFTHLQHIFWQCSLTLLRKF